MQIVICLIKKYSSCISFNYNNKHNVKNGYNFFCKNMFFNTFLFYVDFFCSFKYYEILLSRIIYLKEKNKMRDNENNINIAMKIHLELGILVKRNKVNELL